MKPIRPVVAVPARDEERRLPALLDALSRQNGSCPAELQVVLVLNNCRDGSAAAVEDASRRAPRLALTVKQVELPPDRSHVGEARRIAMDEAAALAGEDGAVLTTDADAAPPPDWVDQTLKAFAEGADLVGGRLIGDPAEEAALGAGFVRRARAVCRYQDLRDELASLIDPLPFDPWPRHHDHTGASLAVRVGAYRRLGGLEPLPFREDLAFVVKARAAGYRLRHPPGLHVGVSARLEGRAKGGMAECLRTWCAAEAAGLPVMVEDPAIVERRLARRAAIRALDDAPPEAFRAALGRLGIPEPVDPGMTAAALIELHAADDPDPLKTMRASDAISILIERIARLREERDAA